jgi:hypothetical protein
MQTEGAKDLFTRHLHNTRPLVPVYTGFLHEVCGQGKQLKKEAGHGRFAFKCLKYVHNDVWMDYRIVLLALVCIRNVH